MKQRQTLPPKPSGGEIRVKSSLIEMAELAEDVPFEQDASKARSRYNDIAAGIAIQSALEGREVSDDEWRQLSQAALEVQSVNVEGPIGSNGGRNGSSND